MPTETIDQPPVGGPVTRQWPRAVAVAVGLTVLAFGASLAVGAVAVLALLALGVAFDSTLGFVALLVASQGAFLLIGAWYVRGRIPVPIRTPTRRDAAWIVGGVVLGLLVATALSFARTAFFPDTDSVLTGPITGNPTLLLYIGVLSVVLIAPAEELLFRGAVQGRLRTALSPVAAILGASTVFGAMHLLNFTGPVAGGIAAAAVVGGVSVVWGYAYERTRNFAVPVLAHGLYNAVLMAVSYLSIVGF